MCTLLESILTLRGTLPSSGGSVIGLMVSRQHTEGSKSSIIVFDLQSGIMAAKTQRHAHAASTTTLCRRSPPSAKTSLQGWTERQNFCFACWIHSIKLLIYILRVPFFLNVMCYKSKIWVFYTFSFRNVARKRADIKFNHVQTIH